MSSLNKREFRFTESLYHKIDLKIEPQFKFECVQALKQV